MDLFEFILVITSVVYALALTQLLTGIGRLAQSDASIHWYLPHTAWMLNLFLAILLSWWTGWEFRNVEWTFPKFGFLFISPIFLFFATTLAILGRLQEAQVDLERHFFRVRRLALWSIFVVLLAQFIDGLLFALPGLLSKLGRFPGERSITVIWTGDLPFHVGAPVPADRYRPARRRMTAPEDRFGSSP